jgi:hypothetical protein
VSGVEEDARKRDAKKERKERRANKRIRAKE